MKCLFAKRQVTSDARRGRTIELDKASVNWSSKPGTGEKNCVRHMVSKKGACAVWSKLTIFPLVWSHVSDLALSTRKRYAIMKRQKLGYAAFII